MASDLDKIELDRINTAIQQVEIAIKTCPVTEERILLRKKNLVLREEHLTLLKKIHGNVTNMEFLSSD